MNKKLASLKAINARTRVGQTQLAKRFGGLKNARKVANRYAAIGKSNQLAVIWLRAGLRKGLRNSALGKTQTDLLAALAATLAPAMVQVARR